MPKLITQLKDMLFLNEEFANHHVTKGMNSIIVNLIVRTKSFNSCTPDN